MCNLCVWTVVYDMLNLTSLPNYLKSTGLTPDCMTFNNTNDFMQIAGRSILFYGQSFWASPTVIERPTDMGYCSSTPIITQATNYGSRPDFNIYSICKDERGSLGLRTCGPMGDSELCVLYFLIIAQCTSWFIQSTISQIKIQNNNTWAVIKFKKSIIYI